MIDLPRITRDEHHVYTTPVGLLRSVTTMLGATAGPKPGLIRWKKKLGTDMAKILHSYKYTIDEHTEEMIAEALSIQLRDNAGDIGTATHDMIERNFTSQVLPDRPALLPRAHYENLKPIRDMIDPYIVEGLLYSKVHKIAGTVDCVGDYGSHLCVIDWKTKRKPQQVEYLHDYYVQCAGYGIMVKEHTDLAPTHGLIGISCETGERQEFLFDLQEYELEFINRCKDFHTKGEQIKVFG